MLPELYLVLLGWAVWLTPYENPGYVPEITYVSQSTLRKIICPGKECSVQALYSTSRGIMINELLDPTTNGYARSVLVHELVHFLQDLDSDKATWYPCSELARREIEAYTAHNRYLTHGEASFLQVTVRLPQC